MKPLIETTEEHYLKLVSDRADLLEALKEAEEIITMAVSGEWKTPDYEGVLLKVSAAIKKAEAQS